MCGEQVTIERPTRSVDIGRSLVVTPAGHSAGVVVRADPPGENGDRVDEQARAWKERKGVGC